MIAHHMRISVWVFQFAAIEAMRAYRLQPFYTSVPFFALSKNHAHSHVTNRRYEGNRIVTYRLPTWSTPLVLCLLVEFFFWQYSSLLCHLCALVVGYAC